MKFLKVTVITAAVLITAVAHAGAIDLSVYKESINKINELDKKISEKETLLNKLKVKATTNNWNFVEFRKKQKNIQKRTRLGREIDELIEKKSEIASELIKSRGIILKELKSGLKSADNRLVLNKMDTLLAENLIKQTFVPVSAITGTEDTEFLKYKADTQAKTLRSIESLMKHLNFKKRAYTEGKYGEDIGLIDTHLDKLGSIWKQAKVSQDAIKDRIKNLYK